jgi:hypothetical protein
MTRKRIDEIRNGLICLIVGGGSMLSEELSIADVCLLLCGLLAASAIVQDFMGDQKFKRSHDHGRNGLLPDVRETREGED